MTSSSPSSILHVLCVPPCAPPPSAGRKSPAKACEDYLAFGLIMHSNGAIALFGECSRYISNPVSTRMTCVRLGGFRVV